MILLVLLMITKRFKSVYHDYNSCECKNIMLYIDILILCNTDCIFIYPCCFIIKLITTLCQSYTLKVTKGHKIVFACLLFGLIRDFLGQHSSS